MADGHTIKVADPRAGIPQERITGDILRGRGPRRGNLEDLLDYWRPIMRKPGGFRRCLVILADHPELYPLPPLCAWLHHETTGKWPNEGNKKRRGGRRSGGKRTVRRAVRRARKDHPAAMPIDVRANMADNESVMSSPIGYGNFGLVDYKASRLLRGAASAFLPGERNMFRISPTRRIGYSLLAPGGRNNPVIGVGLPGRIGGSGRGFRCPPGFENGGKFTDARFSTCGSQLFATPGAKKPIKDTIRTIQRATRQEVSAGSSGDGQAKRPRRGAPNLTKPVKDTVNLPEGAAIVPPRNRTNAGRQNSVATRVEKAMAKAKTEKAQRVIRSDGAILVPSASVAKLAAQRDNDDLKDSVYISKVTKPIVFGGPELELLRADVKKISFVLPGGTTVEVVRNGKINRAEYEKIKKAAFSRVANRPDIPDIDPARPLSQAAAASSKITMNVKPAKTIPAPQRLVIVERGSAQRSVPRWVYETFLSQNAPGRPKDVKPYTFVGVKGKELPEDVEDSFAWAAAQFKHNFNLDTRLGKPWHVDEPTMWGPLDYTASPIPAGDRHWDSLGFKAASFEQAQYDSLHGLQVKKVVFDRAIGRFRCATGTANGGQLTNRSGLGCGGGVVGAVRRAVGAVADRAADAVDVTARGARGPDTKPGDRRNRVPGGRIKPRTPSQAPRRQRGAIRDRLADGLDVTGRPERQRERGRLRDRLADELDFTNVPRRERRRGRIRDRLANLIDPEPVRRDKPRKDRKINFATVVDKERVPDYVPIALRDFRDNQRRKWIARMDVVEREDGSFNYTEAREWLQANKDDISERRYNMEVDDLVDMALVDNALEKNNVAEMNDLLNNLEDRNLDQIYGALRRERADRDRLSLERRERDQQQRRRVGGNVLAAEDLDIPLSEAEKMDDQDRAEVGNRVRRHERSIRQIEQQIEAAQNSNEVAAAVGQLVTQRDKYQKQADEARERIEKIQENSLEAGAVGRQSPSQPLTATERRLYRQWAGAQGLANMYEEANERHRFRVVAQARVEKAAGDGNGFVNINDLRRADLPEARQADMDRLINEVADIDDVDTLDGRIQALRDQQDAALEKIRNAEIELAEVNLTDDKIDEFVKARADAGGEFEAARRGIAAVQGRRREIAPVPVGPDEGLDTPNRRKDALGSFDDVGRPIVQRVEKGANGINSFENAVNYVERGRPLADVPDDYLAEAMVKNMGNGKRFELVSSEAGGINDRHGAHLIVRDRQTDQIMSIKAPGYGAHEVPNEVASNQILAQLGLPMAVMRFSKAENGQPAVVFPHVQHHWNITKKRDGVGLSTSKDVKTRVAVFVNDYLTGHSDRHAGNYFHGETPDGRQVLIPIDNGLAFGMNPDRQKPVGFAPKPGVPLGDVEQRSGGYTYKSLNALRRDIANGNLPIEDVLDAFEESQARIAEAGDFLDLRNIEANLPSGYNPVQKGIGEGKAVNISQQVEYFEKQVELLNTLTRDQLRDILTRR